ncbi:MAG: amino acid ABC transporter permease [Clostridia bacterium]|nr:amino acid ABC transporter permease [Clostridia bacterium]
MTNIEIFKESFIKYEGYKDVLEGLKATIIIAVLGLFIGIIIGTIIATVKIIPKKNGITNVLSKIGDFYVWIFRGTPIVVQLLLFYYVFLPLMHVRIPSMIVATCVFGLNSGAYVSEIMRSGIQSVDIGQLEGSRALGLPFTKSMIKVIIPQAIKNIIPTLGNEFITLLKDTSVVSFIAVMDITKAFQSIAGGNYEYIVPYCVLALFYLTLVSLVTLLVKLAERRLKQSDRK